MQIIINFAESMKMTPASYKFKQIYLIFFTGLLLTACTRSKKIDVSNIPIAVKIERFDHDFDKMRTNPFAQQAGALQMKYGNFYSDYLQLLQIGGHDTSYFKTLREIFA